MFLFLLDRYLELELLDCTISIVLIFFKKLSNCFPKWMYHSAFPSAMCEGSIYFKSLLILGNFSLFSFNHSNRCVSHCSFTLHFPNDK